jgi:crotonobetainyl-CoA:carnitine CoA-transferase CaiB-like acyl-CoA transferase
MPRILDLSRLLPGPYATLCLQGLGMEVIKIEDPAGGDYLRHYPPQLGSQGAWFYVLNRGKKSVTLNLKDKADQEKLLKLLETADVLVESFRPGVMARLGLDPVMLLERYPRLVVASLTGWGQTGPMAQLPGHDIGFMALSGMLSGDYRVPKIQWGDLAAGGLATALKITGALLERERTGRGCWLDIAMLDGLVGLQPARFAQRLAGEEPDQLLTGGVPFYQLYCCSDGGWISVGALEAQFYRLLEEAVGEVSEKSLKAFFATKPRDHWLNVLGDACVVPVLELGEVQSNPQVAGRNLFDGLGLPYPPTGPVEGPAPQLGEHNYLLQG